MSRFQILLWLFSGIYLAECFLWVWADGWLFLSWGGNFSLIQGPSARFRNPWPSGFAYRFRLPRGPFDGPSSLSFTMARNHWGAYRGMAPWLRGLGGGLVLTVLSAFLLYFLRRGSVLSWEALVFFFLFFHLSLALGFWRLHRKLYPGKTGDLARGTLLCLFSPWQSARAADLLGERLFEGFHPLVVARLLMGRDLFLKFARRWLLDLRYPDTIHSEGKERGLYLRPAAEEEFRDLSRWLTGLGEDLPDLIKPPERTHPSHLSYCERCDVEYDIPAGKCSDCGRDLIPFGK